jgi:pyruvate,water dikinase
VDSHARYVVQLPQAASFGEEQVGGKAANISRLHQAGYVTPEGFCVTVSAYERFLRTNQLTEVIASEIGRKPMESMRWEELWDVALRIRSVFSKGKLPEGLVDEIEAAVKGLGARQNLVVRSSAPGEDSAGRSFAGLHESYVGVRGVEEVCERVRQVWASLWSDAALLYRRELKLDPLRSRMAVVIQKLIRRSRSGVAFGRDPRDPSRNRALIEAVPGLCSNLVDGVVDPQRWSLDRSSSEILSSPEGSVSPLLEVSDLHRILGILLSLEELFGSATDLEWTGRRERLTLLQARPITGILPDSDDERTWYLTLSPGSHRMKELCEEVVNRLIPELRKEGERLVGESLEQLETSELLSRTEERAEVLSRWERIYREKFIPFAHGVRQFGRYYNDVMKPDNPYEFVELLETERMLAWSRNEALAKLSRKLRENRPLLEALLRILSLSGGKETEAQANPDSLREISGGGDFLKEFEAFTAEHGELAYQKTYLKQRSDLFLKNILALAQSPQGSDEREEERQLRARRAAKLERDLLQTVGREEGHEALDLLRIARLSWRLRDDDNILMGRLEGQFLRAVELGQARLREAEQRGEVTQRLAEVLETLSNRVSILRSSGPPNQNRELAAGETPRQLVGQPAAPGLGKGRARCIQTLDDLGEFAAGEILVCDAIQPTMTHLVPLAAGVVERRGGMLIHGAIIARELGIPCVNGIRDAVKILQSGELLTVDGYLGIVTVGEATLDLERVD